MNNRWILPDGTRVQANNRGLPRKERPGQRHTTPDGARERLERAREAVRELSGDDRISSNYQPEHLAIHAALNDLSTLLGSAK